MIVGAYAVMAHAQTMRATKDLDVYVRPTPENLQRLKAALLSFGAPANIVAVAERRPGAAAFEGFTFGRPPARVDVLTKMALPYDDIRSRAATFTHQTLRTVMVVGKEDLIALKRSANRAQDRLDIKALTKRTSRKPGGAR